MNKAPDLSSKLSFLGFLQSAEDDQILVHSHIPGLTAQLDFERLTLKHDNAQEERSACAVLDARSALNGLQLEGHIRGLVAQHFEIGRAHV